MTEYFLACVAGAVLDLIFGDPVWLYHPIRIIGNWIAFLEKGIRKLAGDSEKKLKIGGVVLWFLTVIPSWGIPMLCLMLAGKVHPVLKLLLEVFWCGQIFAAKSLYQESMRVYHCLKRDRLEAARKAVARIVGRDTDVLTAEGVAKAAVETVAENTSDGIIAPLFYLLIGGVPLGFAYKAVNTLDSMVGYKDDTYRAIGWASAKLDDLFNWIPARFTKGTGENMPVRIQRRQSRCVPELWESGLPEMPGTLENFIRKPISETRREKWKQKTSNGQTI